MHELSLGTWFIHIATLLEWASAIIIIDYISTISKNRALGYFALAMLPNLASAMAAITWHIFDNSLEIKGLVVLQAALTTLGNICLAFAAWNLFKEESSQAEQ
tara:strand:+ start:2207 stop:2515 length:309 start_codon:yes stop_codon:yes gene_type:complete